MHAEAFNSDGKTDILIREEDKNVFIGECKFYDGPKTVTDTLKQICGYTTWRDVKLAIIFASIERTHPRRSSGSGTRSRGRPSSGHGCRSPTSLVTEFRARMAWPGDDGHLVTLHVSSFVTPMGAARTRRKRPIRDPDAQC